MFAKILKLECITNLHVGNGDVNYNIVDNEVERDCDTNYPTINSSGVKGAFCEFLKDIDADAKKQIFGTEDCQGQIKFLNADLISIPGRVSDMWEKPYALVYTKTMLERLEKVLEYFGFGKISDEDNKSDEKTNEEKPEVEGHKLEFMSSKLKNLFGCDSYLMEEDDFKKDINLPVVARNKLDNGKSVNLFYEEVVPYNTIFMLPILSEDKVLLDKFVELVRNKVVQFGGNASIGYGLCYVSVVK